MNARAKLIKELVLDGRYVVDEFAVADAIIVRSMARSLLPDVAFRSTCEPGPQLRSFRPHRGAKSFRLCRPELRSVHEPRVLDAR